MFHSGYHAVRYLEYRTQVVQQHFPKAVGVDNFMFKLNSSDKNSSSSRYSLIGGGERDERERRRLAPAPAPGSGRPPACRRLCC